MGLQNKIDMTFNYEPITYGEFKSADEKIANGKMSHAIKQIRKGEAVSDCMKRIYGVNSGITHRVAYEDEVYPTQTAGHGDIWTVTGNHPSDLDVLHSQTFPEDYKLGKESVEYICGMSVPPIMIKRIVTRLLDTNIFRKEIKNHD